MDSNTRKGPAAAHRKASSLLAGLVKSDSTSRNKYYMIGISSYIALHVHYSDASCGKQAITKRLAACTTLNTNRSRGWHWVSAHRTVVVMVLQPGENAMSMKNV